MGRVESALAGFNRSLPTLMAILQQRENIKRADELREEEILREDSLLKAKREQDIEDLAVSLGITPRLTERTGVALEPEAGVEELLTLPFPGAEKSTDRLQEDIASTLRESQDLRNEATRSEIERRRTLSDPTFAGRREQGVEEAKNPNRIAERTHENIMLDKRLKNNLKLQSLRNSNALELRKMVETGLNERLTEDNLFNLMTAEMKANASAKVPASVQKELREAETEIVLLQDAQRLLQKPGIGDHIGPFWGRVTSAMSTFNLADEDALELFITIANFGSELIHSRFGGALTPTELARALEFAPDKTDSVQVLEFKLDKLLEIANSARDRIQAQIGGAGATVEDPTVPSGELSPELEAIVNEMRELGATEEDIQEVINSTRGN